MGHLVPMVFSALVLSSLQYSHATVYGLHQLNFIRGGLVGNTGFQRQIHFFVA